jgi:hypothetical protein
MQAVGRDNAGNRRQVQDVILADIANFSVCNPPEISLLDQLEAGESISFSTSDIAVNRRRSV